jgi:hypothetical protein
MSLHTFLPNGTSVRITADPYDGRSDIQRGLILKPLVGEIGYVVAHGNTSLPEIAFNEGVIHPTMSGGSLPFLRDEFEVID